MSTMNTSQPVVDPQTLEIRRAILNENQLKSIVTKLETDNENREERDSAIQRKYNNEQPWKESELREAGQEWRSNRATGFMQSIVKRMIPPYLEAVNRARVLTSSSLPRQMKNNEEREQKEEVFRTEITRTIRSWDEWADFLQRITLEDLLFGYTAAVYTDPFEWRPMVGRKDETLFPNGTPQNAKHVPIFTFQQQFYIHELVGKLDDPEASESAGWNITNLVKAINNARPKDEAEKDGKQNRKREELVRQCSLGTSFQQGANVIDTRHIFVQEFTGTVSHFIIEYGSGDILFKAEDRFEEMEDVLTLFSIEIGDGKLHGSVGAGRLLYNTHVAIEQARNLMTDNFYLGSLILLKTKAGAKDSEALVVEHPIAIVGEDYEVVQHQIKVNYEAFIQLDAHMSRIAELQVGVFMPAIQLDADGEKRTASEINYTASIEAQIKEGLLSRYYQQVQRLVFMMQKRICSVENIREAVRLFQAEKEGKLERITSKIAEFLKAIGQALDPEKYFIDEEDEMVQTEAIDCILAMLRQGLDAKEIYMLAQDPPQETIEDMAAQQSVIYGELLALFRGDTDIDQMELKRKLVSAKAGNNVADELLIPGEDKTIEANQIRQQMVELGSLMQGIPVNISPQDNDLIHMKTIMSMANQFLRGMTPESATVNSAALARNVLNHYGSHVEAALAKGAKPQEIAQFIEWHKAMNEMLMKVEAVIGTQPQSVFGAGNDMAGVTPAAAIPPGGGGSPVSSATAVPETGNQPPTQPQPAGLGNQPLSRGPLTKGPVDIGAATNPGQ